MIYDRKSIEDELVHLLLCLYRTTNCHNDHVFMIEKIGGMV